MTRVVFVFRSLTLLAIVMACTVTSHADEPIPAWAEEASQAYYEANDGSEAAALAALYSVDAVIFVSPTDPGNLGGSTLKLQGRDEIEKFFGDDFENTRYECEWEITGVIEGEHLAAVSGQDTCVELQISSGDRANVPADWLTIYKKDENGDWLIHLEHY
jgi:ketosteroid isomerase-like protein